MSDDSNPEVSQGSTHSVEAQSPALEPFEAPPTIEAVAPLVPPQSPNDDKTVISGSEGAPSLTTIRAGSPQEIASQLLGQSLGHFTLDQFVGGGGMGAVFRAHDQQLDRTVAIKVLSKGHGEEEVVKRFRIEAQSAARLDHENIARVFYVGEDRGWDYIVFEFIDGQNLRDIVQQNGPLSFEEAIQCGLQIAAALQHANERDVVHRDIKPSNVLVTSSGQVKLVDMGLARVHDLKREGDLTESGVTLGTFDYISPEQARDPRNADVRSDLYSLGCTLYFVLTGRPPFPEGNFFQKLLKHQNERHADPRLFRPELDEEFVAVMDKLLAKQPSRRYQTPDELITALLTIADKLGIEASSPRIAAAMKLLPKPNPWVAQLSWIAPLLLLMLGVWGYDAYLRQSAMAVIPLPAPRLLASVDAAPALEESTNNQGENAKVSKSRFPGRLVGPYSTAVQNASPRGPRQNLPGERFGASKSNFVPGIRKQNSDSNSTATSLNGVTDSSNAAPSVPADTLIVTDDPNLLSLGQAVGYFPTLRDACLALSEREKIRVIEIQCAAPLLESSVQIQATQLTIRSAGQTAAFIKFTGARDGFSSRNAAIVQNGGVLRFENIQMEWELPTAMVRGAALMELRDTQRTLFAGCVLTARSSEGSLPTQESPAFLRVESTVEGGMMTPEAMTSNPIESVVDLNNCLVRGDATLLRAAPTATLTLRWSEGIFASAKRLVEIHGASRRAIALARAEIELTRVSLQALEGLVKTTTTLDEPHAIPTHLNLRSSFISSPPESPLVVNQHPPEKSFEVTPLVVDGEGNTYFGATVLWADTSSSGKSFGVYKLKDLVIPWYRESMPGLVPTLLAPDLGGFVASENATADDFLSNSENARRGGFTPELLPLPVEE